MNTSTKPTIFVPAAKHVPPEHEYLLSALECVLGGRVGVYVSGPITTGRRFVDWYLDIGHSLEGDLNAYNVAKENSVVRGNESDIVNVAQELRATLAVTVIEPASLKIHSWSQENFYYFWTGVLDRFISRMIVLDGWQFSVGCAVEFEYAVKKGIQVESMQGLRINRDAGNELILEAAADIERRGRSWEVLRKLADGLRNRSV